MFRSVFIICLVLNATCVFSWHLKERASDASTAVKSQVNSPSSIVDTPGVVDAIGEPKQSEVKSLATKTESTIQGGIGSEDGSRAALVAATDVNTREQAAQQQYTDIDSESHVVKKTVDKIKEDIASTPESLPQTERPSSEQRVNEPETPADTTEHSEAGGIDNNDVTWVSKDTSDHSDEWSAVSVDSTVLDHHDVTETENADHSHADDISREPISGNSDNAVPSAAIESHNTHSHTESHDDEDLSQQVTDNVDTSSQIAVNKEDTSNTNVNTNDETGNEEQAERSGKMVSPFSDEADTTAEPGITYVNNTLTTPSVETGGNEATRDPKDVDPLNIFVDDIKFQRFPPPMDYSTFQEKIVGNKFRKLYILEETDPKLFAAVRQVESKYKMDNDTFFMNFEFRFIFSRTCQKIKSFRIGDHVPDSNKAYFEKDLGDGVTERVFIFSERPDDYVFFMSCTDRKESPYACRDKFYVTLDSAHDPPNQFPWLLAAQELKTKMNLSFDDPRFVFNFVMTPCP